AAPGADAAGGLGYAALAFLSARLRPGITLQQACEQAETLLAERARDIMQLWVAAGRRML
ncbi:glycerate kinase, partial [Bordetella pertussis]|uniref:glycerate kinase n=1 Tax=Bordetella pertussis TaxID=520 RepID=UPI000ACA261E